jgi:hypothetical protein
LKVACLTSPSFRLQLVCHTSTFLTSLRYCVNLSISLSMSRGFLEKSAQPSTNQWGGYQVCQAASFSDPHGNRQPFIIPIDSRPLSPSRWPQYQSRSIPVFPRTLRGSLRESPLLEPSHPLLTAKIAKCRTPRIPSKSERSSESTVSRLPMLRVTLSKANGA